MPISVGEKLHVITRRLFEGDLRRHFAGVVTAVEGNIVRLEGYVFIFDTRANAWDRRHEKRTRIVGVGDSGHIIKVIPPEVEIDALVYQLDASRHLVVTDGKKFALDINEFGAQR